MFRKVIRNIPQTKLGQFVSYSTQQAKVAPTWMKTGAVLAGVGAGVYAYQKYNKRNVHQKAAAEDLPGSAKSLKKSVLETGSEIIQSSGPLSSFNVVMDGFYFINGDMRSQLHSYQFVDQLNDDVAQCLLFDGYDKDSKLIGIEYLISDKIFDALPDNEKKLWHSYVYEVKSGLVVIPRGMPAVENALLKDRVRMYGKTWLFWNTDQDRVPVGIPQLAMTFTDDGQVSKRLVEQRDKEMKINTNDIRKYREELPAPTVKPGADSWKSGQAVQVRLDEHSFRRWD